VKFDRTQDAHAALAQAMAESEARHRAPAVPPHGLPASWHGSRQTGETQYQRSRHHDGTVDEFHIVELIFGDLLSGPSLRVATAQPGYPLRSLPDLLRDEQEFMAYSVPGASQDHRPGTASTLPLTVDGAAVEFEALSDDTITIARADLGAFTLILKARNWDFSNTELVHLTDLEEFIAGRSAAVMARFNPGGQ
jgi:hypothetical protein